jgi:hypothetical protein
MDRSLLSTSHHLYLSRRPSRTAVLPLSESHDTWEGAAGVMVRRCGEVRSAVAMLIAAGAGPAYADRRPAPGDTVSPARGSICGAFWQALPRRGTPRRRTLAASRLRRPVQRPSLPQPFIRACVRLTSQRLPAWIAGCLAGDLALNAQLIEQLAGDGAVVAAGQAAGAALGAGCRPVWTFRSESACRGAGWNGRRRS